MAIGTKVSVILRHLALALLAAFRRLATASRLMRCRAPNRRFGRDLHVGARSRLWAPVSIEISDHCYLGKDVHIETNCALGRFVLIANRVALIGRHDHDFRTIGVPVRFGRWIGRRQAPSPHRDEMVRIDDDVWIGYGATILSGVCISRGAIIAARSVVTPDVAPYTIVAGNPARILGRRFVADDERKRHEAMIRTGRFESSEKGHNHWIVQPGVGTMSAGSKQGELNGPREHD